MVELLGDAVGHHRPLALVQVAPRCVPVQDVTYRVGIGAEEFELRFHTGLGAGGQAVPAINDLAPPDGNWFQQSLVSDACHQPDVVFRWHFGEDSGQVADGITLLAVHHWFTSKYWFLIL